MTQTSLSDMIVPEIFNGYVQVQSTALSRFRQSGIVQDLSAELEPKMGGETVQMPFFNDLTGSDDVIDDTTDLTINAMTTGKDVAVKLFRGKAFGSSDLAGEVAGADPVLAIATRYANFWIRAEQAILLSTVAGQIGALTANVSDISGLVGAAANFDPHSFIDATGVLGDHQDMLAGVAVHSDTYKTMKKQDLIDFIEPSDGGEKIPTYQGKYLIVDDGMPKSAGVYTSYIFGPGAVGMAYASPKVPVEIERRALIGGGIEYIVHRRNLVMHVRGIKWTGTPAGASPTNAELATTGNWSAVYDPKLVRVVSFRHKLG